MEPQRDDDYYLVDDDGNVIEPAAEGSCVMAEGLLEMARAETGEDYIVVEPYVPDFDVAAAQAKARAFLDETAARREAEARDEEEEAESASAGAGAEADEEQEEEDDEEGEAFPAMGSRDMTDPDDWRLEAIVKRRLNKEREGGLWVYLCKWAGHAEPTWETREVMEDAGWIPQLDAYDSKGSPPKHASLKKKSTKRRYYGHNVATLQQYFGGEKKLIEQIVATISAERSGTFMRYCEMNTALAKPFLDRWFKCKDTHVPMIVYHGTRTNNLPSIYRMGLVVGGTKGVVVANGAAYGSGVYTATSMTTPLGYNGGSNSVIVCIGLVPTSSAIETVHHAGRGFLIFRNAEDVYPMWLVQIGGIMSTSVPEMIGFDAFLAYANNSFNYELAGKPITNRLAPVFQSDSSSQTLTESENRAVNRAIFDLKDSKGGIKMSALKGQPRRIRELLARASVERRM